MKIQEHIVTMLNEETWDDLVCNYPELSSTTKL